MDSKGLKRYFATLIGAALVFVGNVPSLSFLTPVLTKVAALLGGVGLLHAAKAQTLSSHLSLSLGAVLQILIASASYVKEVVPFVPFLQELSLLIAAYNSGKTKEPK